MLRLIIGFPSKSLTTYKGFIGGKYLPIKNINTDMSKRIVKEIDKSNMINPYAIESPVLGLISCNQLSGGAQCLIILAHSNEIVPLHFMGDNCFHILYELSKEKDVTVSTGDLRDLFSYGFDKIFVVNENKFVYDIFELDELIDTIRENNYEPYSIEKHINYFKARNMSGEF